jgi:UDP-2,3-diacylglucosamine pyrophosphatase LpxH
LRTLVISDLHLGGRLGRDVLRRPAPLEALLDALDGVDRLVLLGDAVELVAARPQRELKLAAPVLRAIGRRLGADRELILVPGNHDIALVRPWLQAHGVPAAVDAQIPLDATPLLAEVTALLAPARVRVHYPGVWLSERVWATHGHYLNRHLVPESAFGVARGLLGRLPRDGATPVDYEQAGAPSLRRLGAAVGRRLPRPLAAWEDDLAELLRAATMPSVPVHLLSHRFAPLTTVLLGAQMRRASIPALVRVVHRLEVDADWVVFGHVHRCGPLPGDDPEQWRGAGGRPRIANTGSWVYEPLLLHRASSPHPYWPGGAILVEDDGDPQAIGLLDAAHALV